MMAVIIAPMFYLAVIAAIQTAVSLKDLYILKDLLMNGDIPSAQ